MRTEHEELYELDESDADPGLQDELLPDDRVRRESAAAEAPAIGAPCPLIPAPDRLLVIPDRAVERSAGGIHLAAAEAQPRGVIVAVGVYVAHGHGPAVGARCVFQRFAGVVIEEGGQTYLALRADDVVAYERRGDPGAE